MRYERMSLKNINATMQKENAQFLVGVLEVSHQDHLRHSLCCVRTLFRKAKRLKERKLITNRIVTKEDFENVLTVIRQAEHNNEIGHNQSLQFTALVLFGAYTGQRSYSTIKRLTVGQFKEALSNEKPVLHVQSDQDKIRMAHYCSLHPQVIEAILPLVDGRVNDEPMFTHLAFERWAKFKKIQLTRSNFRFVLGDLRKFAEQWGDVIGWNESNRAYILTHGVRGVEWSNYRHPLPEHVYDVYMNYWSDVCFIQ